MTTPHETRYASNHQFPHVPLMAGLSVVSRCHSPISQVSVEILCLIFSFSRSKLQPHLGSFDVHRQNLTVLPLTAVCRHWRSVAIDHAVLWSNIAFTTSALPTIDCATTFLQRSKGTPLHVHIWDRVRPKRPPSHTSLHDALTRLLSFISSQRNRIILLEVIEPSTYLLNNLQGPAENVAQLIVQGRTSTKRSDYFPAKFPNVQQVTLTCPTPCHLGSFTSLTQVTLHGDPRRWNIDAFLDCVDGCLTLKSLSITRCLDFYSVRDSTRTVSLPSLVNLRLNTCDTVTILGRLKLPATASVSVCIDVKHISNNFDNIFSCLPPEIDRVNFLRNTRYLTIVFDKLHGDFHISGFNGATPVFLLQICGPLERLNDGWVHRSFAAATSILPFSDIISLTLVAESVRVPWESWLRQSTHLSTLDVCCVNLGGLAAALNHMQNNTPLCHTLRNLSINIPHNSCVHDEKLLESAILMRKTHGSALSSLTIDACGWDNIRRSSSTWTALVRREGLRFNLLHNLVLSHTQTLFYS